MTLTYQSMTRIALGTHQVGTQIAVTDVGFVAKTENAGSVGQENADIVKHGGFT